MKRIINLILFFIIVIVAKSQQPVKWNYSAKKISGNQYQIYLTANIDEGWHLYSQKQPVSAIALPTKISFTKSPLIKLKGNIQEKGELKKTKEEILETEAWLYENKVNFIQTVELKGAVKTNLTGNIEYQVCTNEKCLPPTTVNFSIALKE